MRCQQDNSCERKESCFFSNTQYCVRMCIWEYNSLSLDTVTIVNTPNTHIQDEDDVINENGTDTDNDNLNSQTNMAIKRDLKPLT